MTRSATVSLLAGQREPRRPGPPRRPLLINFSTGRCDGTSILVPFGKSGVCFALNGFKVQLSPTCSVTRRRPLTSQHPVHPSRSRRQEDHRVGYAKIICHSFGFRGKYLAARNAGPELVSALPANHWKGLTPAVGRARPHGAPESGVVGWLQGLLGLYAGHGAAGPRQTPPPKVVT